MKQSTRRTALSSAALLASLSISSIGAALPTGTDIQECGGCHEHGVPPEAAVTLDRQQVAPGETVKLSLDVVSDAVRSGFLAGAPGGEFSFPEPDFQRAIRPELITHAQPKLFVNGSAKWEFEWTAPNEIGVSVIKVSTVAGDGMMGPEEDGATLLETWVSHGCQAVEYFIDLDEDGYGDGDRVPKASCEPVEGFVPNGADCADDDPVRNPDSAELCNAIDDNCDGLVDEGLNTAVLYPDLDGDGYGSITAGDSILDCPPIAGYSDNFDDCDDRDPMVSPAAVELCNGLDDNCNRIPDDGVEYCNGRDDDCDGIVDNACIEPPTEPASSSAAGAGPVPAPTAGGAAGGAPSSGVVLQPSAASPEGGCAVAIASGSTPPGMLAMLGLFAVALLRRRR